MSVSQQQQQQQQHQFDLEWLLLPQENLRSHVIKRTINKQKKKQQPTPPQGGSGSSSSSSSRNNQQQQQQQEQDIFLSPPSTVEDGSASGGLGSKNKNKINLLPPQWLNVTFNYTMFVSTANSQDILYGYERWVDTINREQQQQQTQSQSSSSSQTRRLEHSSDIFAEYITRQFENYRNGGGGGARGSRGGEGSGGRGFFLKRVEHEGPINATTGVTTLVPGLEIGLQSMEEGEHALIEIPVSDMSFGEFLMPTDKEEKDNANKTGSPASIVENNLLPTRVYDLIHKFYGQNGTQRVSHMQDKAYHRQHRERLGDVLRKKRQQEEEEGTKAATTTKDSSSSARSPAYSNGMRERLAPYTDYNHGDAMPYTLWFDVTVGGSTSGHRLSDDVIKFTQHEAASPSSPSSVSPAGSSTGGGGANNNVEEQQRAMTTYGTSQCEVAIRAAHHLTGGQGTMTKRVVTIGGLDSTLEEDLVLRSMRLGEMATVYLSRREHLFMLRNIHHQQQQQQEKQLFLPSYPVREVILNSGGGSNATKKHVDPTSTTSAGRGNGSSLTGGSGGFLPYNSDSDDDLNNTHDPLNISADGAETGAAAAAAGLGAGSSLSNKRNNNSISAKTSTESLLFLIASELKEDPSYIYDFVHSSNDSSRSSNSSSSSSVAVNNNKRAIHKKFYNYHNIDFIYSSSSTSGGGGGTAATATGSISSSADMVRERLAVAEALKEHATKLMVRKHNTKAITNYCRSAVVLLAKPSLLDVLSAAGSGSKNENERNELRARVVQLLTVLCANVGRNLEVLGFCERGVRWATRSILLSISHTASATMPAILNDNDNDNDQASLVSELHHSFSTTYPKAYFLRAQLNRQLKRFAVARQDLEFLVSLAESGAAAAIGSGSAAAAAAGSRAGSSRGDSPATPSSAGGGGTIAGLDMGAVSFELSRLNEAEEATKTV